MGDMEQSNRKPEGNTRRIGRLTQHGTGTVQNYAAAHPSVTAETHRQTKEKETVRKPENTKKTEGWQERLKKQKQKRLHRALWAFAGVLAAAYCAAAIYFGFHFYEGTEIYGIDCSQLTLAEVKQEVKDKLQEYRLEIQERENQSEYVTAKEIGLQFTDNGSIDQMMKDQRSYIWPVMLLLGRQDTSKVAFSYDVNTANSVLDALNCMNALGYTAPQDAYIETTATGYSVASEIMGTTLDAEKTRKTILDSLDLGKTSISLEEKECYINPVVYQTDEQLQSDAEAMSALAHANITYEFGESREVVNPEVIRDWIVKTGDGTFVIDDVCVTNFVTGLAEKYDTFGLTREFYTSIGTTVTLTGGDYGWCIDQDATVVALLNALQEGYQGTMEPVYLYTAMSRENHDIGYTYVEICISRQEMWCYQDGNCIVDTPIVTGNPNKGNGTPSGGVWAIDAKKRNAVLVGEGYQAPVDYWMPFNGNIGIHDLQQRANFGGSIYLSNGSHGCVNTPYEQVQTIYNAVSIGTPVIVYE